MVTAERDYLTPTPPSSLVVSPLHPLKPPYLTMPPALKQHLQTIHFDLLAFTEELKKDRQDGAHNRQQLQTQKLKNAELHESLGSCIAKFKKLLTQYQLSERERENQGKQLLDSQAQIKMLQEGMEKIRATNSELHTALTVEKGTRESHKMLVGKITSTLAKHLGEPVDSTNVLEMLKKTCSNRRVAQERKRKRVATQVPQRTPVAPQSTVPVVMPAHQSKTDFIPRVPTIAPLSSKLEAGAHVDFCGFGDLGEYHSYERGLHAPTTHIDTDFGFSHHEEVFKDTVLDIGFPFDSSSQLHHAPRLMSPQKMYDTTPMASTDISRSSSTSCASQNTSVLPPFSSHLNSHTTIDVGPHRGLSPSPSTQSSFPPLLDECPCIKHQQGRDKPRELKILKNGHHLLLNCPKQTLVPQVCTCQKRDGLHHTSPSCPVVQYVKCVNCRDRLMGATKNYQKKKSHISTTCGGYHWRLNLYKQAGLHL